MFENQNTDSRQIKKALPRLLILGFFFLLVIYSLVKLITMEGTATYFGENLKADEVFVRLLQSLVGLPAALLIPLVKKFLELRFSLALEIIYLIFLFLALGMGSVIGFFVKIPGWDKLTHFYSSALLTMVGYGLWHLSLEGAPVKNNRQKGLGLLLGLSFSGLVSVFWELFEYTVDGIRPEQNTQRFMNPEGQAYIGRDALNDTMGDLIFNTLGALVGMVLVLFWEKWVKDKPFDYHLSIDWVKTT